MSGTGKTVKYIAATGNQLVDALLDGYAWADARITYSFPTLRLDYSYGDEPLNGFEAVSRPQKKAALFALEQSFGKAANDGFSVEGFTNASFSSGPASSAHLRFAQSQSANPTAYAYMPGAYKQAGDIWFGTDYDYLSPTAGNYAWHTLMHELGHALGLKHGHETGGNGALPYANDSLEYSIMTYRTFVGDDGSGYSYEYWGAPQTFMMSDIAALQEMYGADFTTNRTATIYSWTPGSGVTLVNGEIAIKPGGNRIFATIWDGGGRDTYNLKAYTTSLEIDLRPGEASTFSGSQLARLGNGHLAGGNIYNALLYHDDHRSLIENAIGGSGSDAITGNEAGNRLSGGAGKDFLNGLSGNDILVGGKDSDQFVFACGSGTDRIRDFTDGEDIIDLRGSAFVDFADIAANAVETFTGVTIDFGGGDILVLAGVTRAELDSGDFLFAA